MEQVFDVERPKEVELVQRGGTGPKINRTFSVEMEQPKEVEQAQEQRIDQQYLGASQYFPLAGWRIVSSWAQANSFLCVPLAYCKDIACIMYGYCNDLIGISKVY